MQQPAPCFPPPPPLPNLTLPLSYPQTPSPDIGTKAAPNLRPVQPAWVGVMQISGATSKPKGAACDVDGDGDLDIVIWKNELFADTMMYFKNIGNPTNPSFQQVSVGNPFSGLLRNGIFYRELSPALPSVALFGRFNRLSFYSRSVRPSLCTYLHPNADALADIDGDGDCDLVAGTDVGELQYFENTGTPGQPAYQERTGSQNPWDGIDVGGSNSGNGEAYPTL